MTPSATGNIPNDQTRILARFAADLKFHKLPSDVAEHAKTCVLDALGSVLLGSTHPWGKIMTEYVKSLGGKPESVVVGSGMRIGSGNAALANGTMGHGFEADDAFIRAVHHPGSVIVPTALATAERENSSGQEFLAAVVAGYELMNRVGEAATESHLLRGFFPTGTNGPFGAAAAAGNLIRLNEVQMTDAFGIAGSQSAGVFEGTKEGRMTKRFGAGRAAQSGLMAADLAKLGFTGPTTVIEGEWGYLRAYSDKRNLVKLTERLGEKYTIMETTFKPYPCCKALHAAIDAVLELNSEHHFDADRIDEVIVGGYEKLRTWHDIYEPASSMAAQFSIPYAVSASLLGGAPKVETFEEPSIKDKKILDFARKVKTVLDPEIIPYFPAHEPGKVTIKLKNGESYSKAVIQSKGTPDNPMTRQELETKFMEFASRVMASKQAEKAVELIFKLEKLNRVSDLSALLCQERK